MAKRDKLYTVNKWNKPFFDEDRRKRLYGLGGNPVWGLNLNQGLTRAGIGFAPEGTNAPMYIPWVNQQDSKVTNWYSHTGQQQPTGTLYDVGVGYQGNYRNPVETSNNTDGIKQNDDSSSKSPFLSAASSAIDNIPKIIKQVQSVSKPATSSSAAKVAGDALTSTVLNGKTYPFALSSFTGDIPAFAGTAEVSTEAAKHASDMIAKDIASASASTASKGTNFFNTGLGSGLAMTAADLASDYVGGLISPELNKTTAAQIGNIIGKAGTAVGTGLMATGYGLPIGLLAMGVGKTLGALAKQFGSVKNDNGTSNYIYTLEGSNPQGSNEYLANLQATTGYGPEATYSDGIFTDSGKYWARRQNRKVADAYENYQRKIRNALSNNNWIQMQHAIYENSKAMGGKLNRKKCNCKATGGFLNNAMLDSASATGYNFLSDLTNMQMQNNQNKQDMGSSLGNSFTGLSNGTLFANGGGININPAHKGEFTAKAKRHGMGVQQFANYVLAHKDKFPTSTIRQAVFAKNSNTWKKAFGGKLNYGKDKDIRDSGFFDGQTLYAIGGPLQAMSSNWSPGGNVTEINAGGQHEENPYEGVQVGVDPEGTPNLVEENEVIWNDYVFSNRLKVPKEVCKELRVGQKKDGFTFAEVAKKLLKESKERPNDPISKRGLDANMQKLEDAQEELKQKMEAEEAVEQFNSLPPEQQVAIMQQEGEKAQDAVAQEQMAQQIQNLPPEQQQAIAQQMAMEQAQQQGMPQQGMSPEEQYAMQQQAAQDQYAAQRDARNQEVLAQAAAMQQAGLNGAAFGGKLFELGGNTDVNNLTGPIGRKAKAHWERDARGNKVLVPNSKYGWEGFGGGSFGSAGGGASWGEDPAPLMPRKRDWLAIDYKESFNKAYERARKEKKKTFWFNGKEYSTAYNPNLTKEEVEAGNNRYQTKGLLITPWEHAYGGLLFAEGGELGTNEGQLPEEQYQQNEQPVEQADNEMAKYSDEELQDMIEDYQEAESGEVKVTKGKLARLRKKAEKAQAELERRHAEENEEQPKEARQEPSQEEVQAAAQEQAKQAQQPIEGQPQEDMPQEGMSPEQAMMMQQQTGGQPQISPEEMAAMELQQQGNGQYAYGGKVNKYAYAGPLKPQPTSPFTEVQGAIYGKRPDIPQEVYDWFISLTPDERFDLFGGTDFWSTRLEDYNEDPNNWYNDYKKNPSSPNRRYWRAAVTNEESVDRDNSDWHTIVLDAYKNRRDSSGKYIPYNLSQDIIHWYANLPEDERKKIVANTKMKGKDFSTVVEYANKGAAGPVTEAIVNAYNAANGDSSTSTINSPDGQIVGGAQQTIPTSSIDYAPYFRGMTTNDIFGQIWDQMSSERRNGISRKDFIANNSNLPTNGWSSYNDELLNVYYNLHPEARNSGWTFNSNPYRTYANVNFHDAKSAVGNNGNKMVAESFYANDPAWSQLTEQEKQLKGNKLAAALEATPAYQDFSQYLRDNRTSQYVKDYFTELANRGSKIAKNALADWDNMTDSKFDAVIKNLREDASAPPNSPGNKNNNALGLGHFTPAFAENWTNRYWIKDADGNYSQVIGGIADADKDKYIAINTNPYQVTVDNNNYNDYYYRLKTDADNAATTTDNESNYLTVGWKPKTHWEDYALGVLPGLTGLGMMLAQGKPDVSGLEAIANSYANNAAVTVAPHLTHGLMKPAIIDPRVTYNTMNAQRLGTNRLLTNTGSTPSKAASILANDMNYQNQMGQALMRDWLANRQQEQAAAQFNRETATTNANILNQTDQFNANMLANAAEKSAQLRYNAAKEKLDQDNAYRAGILGNIGSAMTGLYNAYREGQNRNERDLLAASEVFGPTNGLLDEYYGISKVDPKTGKVVRGPYTDWYWYDNDFHKQPKMAISAKGGKLNRKNKKKKGYTF